MTQEFRLLADEALRSHGATFSTQNKEQIDAILAPPRERIGEFQTTLADAQTASTRERATLAAQISNLAESSLRMTTETANLTRALKGDSQTQGAWGEMILGSILERSGLREGEEYEIQQSHTNEEGRRLRPDAIVHLPGGQRIVIDSKVSLVAFDLYVNSAGEERAAHSVNHLTSMRSHYRTWRARAIMTQPGAS